jgi:undecaprenyl-diphosphatase
LPISSSAHLILVRWFLGWTDPGLSFDAALHLGTLLGVVLYFRRDWLDLIGGFFEGIARRRLETERSRLAWLIALGVIPAAIAGMLGEQAVSHVFHGSGTGHESLTGVALIAVMVILLGMVLYVADRTSRQSKHLGRISVIDVLLIGCAQAIAVIPGVSRSGATITMGLLRGMTRETAARFSFLLGTPVIAGAGIKELAEIAQAGLISTEIVPLVGGMLAAAVVGYLAIAFLLRFLLRNSTTVFVLYRLAFGLVVLGVVWIRWSAAS